MTNFERLKTDIQKMKTATDFEDYLYEELELDCESCTEIDCIECICDKLDESKMYDASDTQFLLSISWQKLRNVEGVVSEVRNEENENPEN